MVGRPILVAAVLALVGAGAAAAKDIRVANTGSGSGRVTFSAPFQNKSCVLGAEAACTRTFFVAPTLIVLLRAIPDETSVVGSWGGLCSGSGSSCTVFLGFLSRDTNRVSVAFDPKPRHRLEVVRAGDGFGRVTSEPAGINCGSDCTHRFFRGSQVTLRAIAALPIDGAVSEFSGWSGPCRVSVGTCTITMTEARTVRAHFELVPPGG